MQENINQESNPKKEKFFLFKRIRLLHLVAIYFYYVAITQLSVFNIRLRDMIRDINSVSFNLLILITYVVLLFVLAIYLGYKTRKKDEYILFHLKQAFNVFLNGLLMYICIMLLNYLVLLKPIGFYLDTKIYKVYMYLFLIIVNILFRILFWVLVAFSLKDTPKSLPMLKIYNPKESPEAKLARENAINTYEASNNFSFSDEEIKKGRLMATFSYLGILIILPLIFKRKNAYTMYHVKQGLKICVILVLEMVLYLLVKNSAVLISLVTAIFNPITGVLSLMGMLDAWYGKARVLPIIGKEKH